MDELLGFPEYLYHYTSVQGVDGILNNKLVWASELHFLNDSKEWKHAFELAQEQILKRFWARQGDAEWQYLLRELGEALRYHSWDVCVFSLSATSNQLSQWRAYCPSEGGYAIRFRTVHLLDQLRAQGFALFRCEYDLKIQTKRIDTILSSVLKELVPDQEKLRSNRSVLVETTMAAKSEILNQIAMIAPTLKHPDFKEESEWRAFKLIFPGDTEMSYHLRGNVAVPHYKLHLDAAPGAFPIDEITVGPGNHQELARRGLSAIVNKARMRIKVSQTPLRNL